MLWLRIEHTGITTLTFARVGQVSWRAAMVRIAASSGSFRAIQR